MSKQKKVLIFIVAYSAENTIQKVLDRIPRELLSSVKFSTEILIIDDASRDQTFEKAQEYKLKNQTIKLTVLHNPKNLGYGGNQKVGYFYAIKNKFDIVAMVHGDGQYAPEKLPDLLQPLINDNADAVFGSRMIEKGSAIKGGMPVYKYIGNKILTTVQNTILGSRLSEFHSGYRLYNVHSLSKIPFQENSNNFDFDTDIIIQFVLAKFNIVELPIPTFYGDEVCHVNGWKYALDIILSTLRSKVTRLGIFYHPKYDVVPLSEQKSISGIYDKSKIGYKSSHQMGVDFANENETILTISHQVGFIEPELKKKNCTIYAAGEIFKKTTPSADYKMIPVILQDFKVPVIINKVDKILALDVIGHIFDPVIFMHKLREISSKHNSEILITTGNVNFFILRIMHLFGFWNYSKEGILNYRNARMFTFKSLKEFLITYGFQIKKIKGIPAPYPKAIGLNIFSKLLIYFNTILILFSKNLFAYQMAFYVTALPTLNTLLDRAKKTSIKKAKKIK